MIACLTGIAPNFCGASFLYHHSITVLFYTPNYGNMARKDKKIRSSMSVE